MSYLRLPDHAVLDGGTATELTAMGHKELDSDPLWSARLLSTNISAIKEVHKRYLEAGADIIETVTYQASIEGFMKYLKVGEEEARSLISSGVKAATDVRDRFWTEHPELHKVRIRPIVAASIGPYGASQADGSEYTGAYVDSMSKKELADWHRPHVAALLAAGAELLAIDTLPAKKEAEAVVELLAEFPSCRAWVSFSCKDGEHTCYGDHFSDAVQVTSASEQVVGVGINCTAPEHVEHLLKSSKHNFAGKQIVVYPNSGERWGQDKSWHPAEDCRHLPEYIATWWALGARWIGGCCRVGPREISLIRKRVVALAGEPNLG